MVRNPLIPRRKTLVVVANDAAAQFYSRPAPKADLESGAAMENEDGRKRTGELLSDRGGRSFDSFGQGRHTMTNEKTGPKQQAARAFDGFMQG